MKFKNLAVIASMLSLGAVANAQNITSYFVNPDFDSGIVTTPGPFKGFDAPAAPEIVGWSNYGTVTDGGVEAAGAWWINGYAYGNCAFVNVGGGAYNLSSYTIHAGDLYDISFIGDGWGGSSATVSLFYDNPANVIGSYSSTLDAWFFAPHATATPIAATLDSVNKTLGILIVNDGANNMGFDQFTVNVTPAPEPGTMALLALGSTSLLLWRRRSAK